ncbi:gamma-glutamyltransferase [Flaviaesturariibacter flavus]|uniref:Glutathione hydrolase proenzyme n=1 Tax=Flaviaesturariibacter flavus TaxID=2502780 RepID=A0A4R1B3H8_9BACT|nr:gamma-glutamyltransferase [Flaviaesturariibacter flavus]TCJ12040.1 gamma-glutamyltransferase [Flaviaesturariibacter flavus]
MRNYLFVALLALAACRGTRITAPIDAYHVTVQKKAEATHGAVVSAHPLASQVGLSILKAGGNAVDAAIATQLALAVVYPGAGNIGGGGFMVARLADGKSLALDYRETAPAAAHRDIYLDAQGNVIEGASVNGHRAGGVPGTVAGLFESHRYGRLPFRRLIEPAIQLAEKGFVLTEREAAGLNNIQQDLARYNTRPNAFQKSGRWKGGDTLLQPELAATLRRIRDGGAAGFYSGETARLIVDEMQRGSGLITPADLSAYKAKWREPHTFTYKGHEVIGMPMPSSGGTLLHAMMKMVEEWPIYTYGHNTPETVNLMAEAERRAYADRAEHMGDADFYPVPEKALVSEAYLRDRMKDYVPGKAGNSTLIKPGTPGKESEQTTHLSVLDGEGNAVSVTTTLNNSYGSKTVIGGAGFLLNDEMDDFSAKPGVPNIYGAVGGAANAVAPGKRMLSSMTPTIVLKDGKPWIVVGTPGGTTIPTSVFQALVNIIDLQLDAETAINAPKFHHQWLPDVLYVEKGFPADVRTRLEAMGYKIEERGQIGRTEIIQVRDNGTIIAVGDRRGDDDARGY